MPVLLLGVVVVCGLMLLDLGEWHQPQHRFRGVMSSSQEDFQSKLCLHCAWYVQGHKRASVEPWRPRLGNKNRTHRTSGMGLHVTKVNASHADGRPGLWEGMHCYGAK